jgi:multidrug transporter EmrE-like cation transporter
MKNTMLAATFVSVLLSSGAQILMKYGMTDSQVVKTMASHDYRGLALTVATSPGVVGGVFSFAVSVVLWLFVLSSVPLSTAYPFVALGICITTFAGYTLFHDVITLTKLAGVALIVCGITLVAVAR